MRTQRWTLDGRCLRSWWGLSIVLVSGLAAGGCDPAALGESCITKSDCQSNICSDKVCRAGRDGDPCSYIGDCDEPGGYSCFDTQCEPKRVVGGACEYNFDCQGFLDCRQNTCVDEGDKETRLLEASRGPTEPTTRTAELAPDDDRRVPPPATGDAPTESPVVLDDKERAAVGAVRIASTSDKGDSFAACRVNERLIGGGCQAYGKPVTASYPSDGTESDTKGARWNCRLFGSELISSYALCQALPAGDK